MAEPQTLSGFVFYGPRIREFEARRCLGRVAALCRACCHRAMSADSAVQCRAEVCRRCNALR